MSTTPPDFLCSLSLHAGLGYLDESRLRLLQEIRSRGTLTAAAEALKISYKTAWSWLDAMGNAASGPLVESVQGGAHGGTSRLTELGETLLLQYEDLRERHHRFLCSLQDAKTPPLNDVQDFLRRMSLHTSARNQLHGTIERIWGDTAQAWIDVMIDNLAMVTARVARASVAEMGLDIGSEVATLTKATCMTLALPTAPRPIPRKGPVNRIKGRLARAIVDEDYAQATLEIATGRTLTALVPIDAWQCMQAKPGEELVAWFDPDHVILARFT